MSLPPTPPARPVVLARRQLDTHRTISYIKSAVRIGASLLFIGHLFTAGAIVLIIAEIGGIMEEVYGS